MSLRIGKGMKKKEKMEGARLKFYELLEGPCGAARLAGKWPNRGTMR